ncbi:hypothetical protein GEV33_015345 [Tenebrio molitor]|nr:hypothetical protein GEV33_015345 [Tenebrio molitor]
MGQVRILACLDDHQRFRNMSKIYDHTLLVCEGLRMHRQIRCFGWDMVAADVQLVPQVRTNFAGVVKPLTHLTKKNDTNKSDKLRTDGDSYVLGVDLLQEEGPEEHPIEYTRPLLKPPEKKTTTLRSENPLSL